MLRPGKRHDPCRCGRRHRVPRASVGDRQHVQEVAEPSGPGHRRRLGSSCRCARLARDRPGAGGRHRGHGRDRRPSRIAVGRTRAMWSRVDAIRCARRQSSSSRTRWQERWAILPKGTGPFEHMRKVFARHNLALPNVVVETRSMTALKSSSAARDSLAGCPSPCMTPSEKAGLIDTLEIPGASDKRTLTAFRRRAGMLPGPSIKLLEELRAMTGQQS